MDLAVAIMKYVNAKQNSNEPSELADAAHGLRIAVTDLESRISTAPCISERDIQLPWAALHLKWRWAARDEDGSIFLFTDRPSADDGIWRSETAESFHVSDGTFANVNPGTKPWDQSLTQRPEE